MIDYTKYGELRTVDFGTASGWVKDGWVILGTVQISTAVSLSRNAVMESATGSYPNTYSYSDSAVGPDCKILLGLPLEKQELKWKEDHDALMRTADKYAEEISTLKGTITTMQAAEHKLKSEHGELKAKADQLNSKLLSASATVAAQLAELNKLKAGMVQMVSKVGGATLNELITQDHVEEEIKKAAEMAVDVKMV